MGTARKTKKEGVASVKEKAEQVAVTQEVPEPEPEENVNPSQLPDTSEVSPVTEASLEKAGEGDPGTSEETQRTRRKKKKKRKKESTAAGNGDDRFVVEEITAFPELTAASAEKEGAKKTEPGTSAVKEAGVERQLPSITETSSAPESKNIKQNGQQKRGKKGKGGATEGADKKEKVTPSVQPEPGVKDLVRFTSVQTEEQDIKETQEWMENME